MSERASPAPGPSTTAQADICRQVTKFPSALPCKTPQKGSKLRSVDSVSVSQSQPRIYNRPCLERADFYFRMRFSFTWGILANQKPTK